MPNPYRGEQCSPGHDICFIGAGNQPENLSSLKYKGRERSWRPSKVVVHVWKQRGIMNDLYCCPTHHTHLIFQMLKAGLESNGKRLDSNL